ncbi:MAG: FtsX-like permease family protein [Acidobacteriia bacterium]|nr:FtsX-like permease family protein [Terriglobia bacterium]
MTRSRLVIKNLLRNRRRTILTFLSVATTITLLAVFCATYRYFDAPLMPSELRLLLMVSSRTSMMIPLPLSYGERIARLPGVAATTPINMVDGLYGGQDDLLFALASDPVAFFKVYPDWHLPEDQRAAYLRERTAALAGRRTALKYGWKLGDRIHLRSPGYHVDLDLVLRGIYTAQDESLLGFHWDYLNEALDRLDKPGGFWVRAQTEEDVPRLMQTIDNQFRNGEMETRTQPMGQWVLDFLAMIGNVKLIVLSVSAAMVFAVLLVVANTMGMSIRERTAELAILRVLGFRPKQLLALLAAESLTVSVTGAVVGCLLAGTVFALIGGYRIGGAMPIYIQVDGVTVGIVLSVAIGIGLSSTLIPAYRALGRSIAQALRFVG